MVWTRWLLVSPPTMRRLVCMRIYWWRTRQRSENSTPVMIYGIAPFDNVYWRRHTNVCSFILWSMLILNSNTLNFEVWALMILMILICKQIFFLQLGGRKKREAVKRSSECPPPFFDSINRNMPIHNTHQREGHIPYLVLLAVFHTELFRYIKNISQFHTASSMNSIFSLSVFWYMLLQLWHHDPFSFFYCATAHRRFI